MALTKFTTSMDIIAALDDEPNDIGGLSATQLKATFDESGNAIKAYINETLTVEADETFATKAEVQSVVLGQIPDGTITETKIANGAITTAKLETTLATKINGAAQADDLIDTAIGLSNASKTALGLTGTKYVSDSIVSLITLANSKAKIEKKSYSGANVYGSSNPNSLTFDGVPQLVFIQSELEGLTLVLLNPNTLATSYRGSSAYTSTVSWSGNTVSWYATTGAAQQFNATGNYRCVALLI